MSKRIKDFFSNLCTTIGNYSNAEYFALVGIIVSTLFIVYYMFFPGIGELHSDCTDTLMWALASYSGKTIINWRFNYACFLPFGGHLLMLIFMPFFGTSLTTHLLGMLLFLILFVTFIIIVLRKAGWHWGWVFAMVFSVLLMLSGSTKIREIFWLHIIYYSLGALFWLVGMSITLSYLKAAGNEDKKKSRFNLIAMFIWCLLCGTNGMQAFTVFTIPLFAGVFLDRFFDTEETLNSPNSKSTLKLLIAILAATLLGYIILKLLTTNMKTGYADAYSKIVPSANWVENAEALLTDWFTLIGADYEKKLPMLSLEAIMNILYLLVGSYMPVLCLVATCHLPKIKDRFTRIVIFSNLILLILIMLGWIFGMLSSAAWRLSPVLFSTIFTSIVFLKWLYDNSKIKRVAILLLLPVLVCSCVSAYRIAKLPPDNKRDEGIFLALDILEEADVEYGYATFWNANITTMLSNDRFKARSIDIEDNDLVPSTYQGLIQWYTGQENADEYFVLLTATEYQKMINENYPDITEYKNKYIKDKYVLLIYDHNPIKTLDIQITE